MCKSKVKKDAPAAAVSRVPCMLQALPADASRPAVSGWGRPAWSLLVEPHLTISFCLFVCLELDAWMLGIYLHSGCFVRLFV